MKIVHFDRKTGELKLQVDTLDDLWHLDKVLAPGDQVEAHTLRTYKVGNREEKKPVTVRVKPGAIWPPCRLKIGGSSLG